MIRLYTDRLQISYGNRLIVKDMKIEIPDKKITTIIGSNGCGKSTLLKAITRIIPHQSGRIILDGESILKQDTKELAKKWPYFLNHQKVQPALPLESLYLTAATHIKKASAD